MVTFTYRHTEYHRWEVQDTVRTGFLAPPALSRGESAEEGYLQIKHVQTSQTA